MVIEHGAGAELGRPRGGRYETGVSVAEDGAAMYDPGSRTPRFSAITWRIVAHRVAAVRHDTQVAGSFQERVDLKESRLRPETVLDLCSNVRRRDPIPPGLTSPVRPRSSMVARIASKPRKLGSRIAAMLAATDRLATGIANSQGGSNSRTSVPRIARNSHRANSRLAISSHSASFVMLPMIQHLESQMPPQSVPNA